MYVKLYVWCLQLSTFKSSVGHTCIHVCMCEELCMYVKRWCLQLSTLKSSVGMVFTGSANLRLPCLSL